MPTEKALLVDKQSEKRSPKLRLKYVRAELGLSQNQLAIRANLHFNVIKNCENGKYIRLASAFRILRAINPLRAELGLPALKLGDLDWQIFGFEPEELQGK